MKINIKDTEIELIYCMRVMTKYEEKTGTSISYDTLATSYTTIEKLFYCAILGTLEHKKYRHKVNITLTEEEFKDWLDDNDGFKMTREFSKWFIDNVNKQLEQMSDEVNKDSDAEEGNKSKKN